MEWLGRTRNQHESRIVMPPCATGWISTTRTTGPLFLGTGAYDTVGSGAVHMLGGVAALTGAAIVGGHFVS